jgi:hypothetical protein
MKMSTPSMGTSFPPTWVVIDNGNASDSVVADKIASYLMAKFPPVLAVKKEITRDTDPDSVDFMVHGIIIIGGPASYREAPSKWAEKYLMKMDPGWVYKETKADFFITRTTPAYETNAENAFLISSIAGQFPWLTVFNIAGTRAAGTVKAGAKFCAGEVSGIWIDDTKQ